MNPIFLTALVALPTGLTSLAIVRARRSARRNHEERCGNCDGPLYAPGVAIGAHHWLPAIATLLSYPAILGGAVSWMKRANRQAAHRLGLQPDVLHVTAGAATFKLTAHDVARLRGERTDA